MDTCTLYTPLSSSGAIDPRGTRFAPGASSERSNLYMRENSEPGRSTVYKLYNILTFSPLRCALTYSTLYTERSQRTTQSRRLYLIHKAV